MSFFGILHNGKRLHFMLFVVVSPLYFCFQCMPIGILLIAEAPMLFFVATKYGFMLKPGSRRCVNDIRLAYSFESFADADNTAKSMFKSEYYAVLSNCIGLDNGDQAPDQNQQSLFSRAMSYLSNSSAVSSVFLRRG